ncbi:hypothetical protein [Ruminococcus sp.]|uniref:hypothetical protein n=1 Tax=Ruminococcus sp. TaxID=41978 RepID=UPI0025EDAFBF|nr:hypothetical protein [Ruminococcus sp.]MBQ8965702.1 hypothetical protein [Ruminococcus sp.]
MPEKFTVRSGLTKKKLLKRISGDMVEYRPSWNILSTGRFMRAHRTESVYYGRISGSEVELYYHRAGKRDGGSTGFYGTVSETEEGCVLTGRFRKPVYAYVTAAVFVVLALLCALGTYAGGSSTGALVFLGIGALGAFAMLWDRSKKQLKTYLSSFGA